MKTKAQEILQDIKQKMQTAQASRDAVVEQGRRAFRLGIEKRNNPLRDPSARNLWEKGYDLEEKKFHQTWGRGVHV